MSSTNIIQLYVGRSQDSDGGAYLDRVVALAYEQGFPLYGLDVLIYNDGTVDRDDRRIHGSRQEDVDEIINRIRGCYENTLTHRAKKHGTLNAAFYESLNKALGNLLDCYRKMHKTKSSYEPEMHRTLCCFWRLELDFFLKFKNFHEHQRDHYNASERGALARDIRDEYPLAMFTEALVEFFDACMAHYEGYVKDTTEMTKGKYKYIKHWHSMLS